MHKKNQEISVPTPKLFEADKYIKNAANNLKHFKSLTINSKKSILKTLNMEVIILYYYNCIQIQLIINIIINY